MKNIIKLAVILSLSLLVAAGAFAMDFAPFAPCKTAGADLYVKKFKDTKLNDIIFLNEDGVCEIKFESYRAGSMLVRKVALDSKKYKYISFDFKVDNIIEKANLKKKSGDDAPARLYVFFEFEKDKAGMFEKMYRSYSKNERDGNSIVYVWGSHVRKGEVIENPYSRSFIQIVVESGKKNTGKYMSFKRNVYEDFKKYFKYEPPATITSIAIMTDTDNTEGLTTGYFRNISLSTE